MFLLYGWKAFVFFAANVFANAASREYGSDIPQLTLQQHIATTTAPTAGASKTPILSADFLAYVEDLRQNASIPGTSLGIVRLAGENEEPVTQFAAFGRKLEESDGDDLTSDVGRCFIVYAYACTDL